LILRASFALIALACPAGAEVSLLSMEFSADAFVVMFDEPIDAEKVPDLNGKDAIAIRLGPSAAESFAAFTKRHVGEEAIIRICGQEVSRPVLRGPIEGGSFLISGDLAEDAERWLHFLDARSCDQAQGS